MNGRLILFGRLLGGFLAYLLCGLAYSVEPPPPRYLNLSNYQETTNPVGDVKAVATAGGYKDDQVVTANSCPGIPAEATCTVTVKGSFISGGQIFGTNTYSLNFKRIKSEPCAPKAGQAAGVWNVTMPGTKWENGSYVKTNADAHSTFIRSGSPSCDGTCALTSDGGYITDAAGKNVYGNANTGTAYGKIKMKWTGAECTLDPNAKDIPRPTNSNSSDSSFTPPNGQADCPAKTTYGEVNGVKRCVKNAPLPTDPNPPPKPGDPDACIGDCSKWDPSKDTGKDPDKPTDPTKPGGTTTGKGPLGSDASKPASENASGPGDSSLAASCTDFKCKNKDPATCEIARLAWNNKCIEEKAFKELTESELYKSGNKSMSSEGIDDMKLKLNFNGEGTLDMTDTIKKDRFLSGGGLADVSFSVYGKSYSLPFSKINKYLAMCGDIVVAFSLIAAAKILSSAV